ncbi:hypothetical protein [Ostreiculturibacter nitratireducens]|uniref:hypothetical protein n=1 Tax=Ostreiculturibacter nitratireducens TaxID=3075226 RepID=UPI0031B58830
MDYEEIEADRQANEKRRQQVPVDMSEWITAAERVVHKHFTLTDQTARNALVVQLATAMMLEYRLGEVDASLDHIRRSIENPNWR